MARILGRPQGRPRADLLVCAGPPDPPPDWSRSTSVTAEQKVAWGIPARRARLFWIPLPLSTLSPGHDGFECIYAQRLDPASKRPAGAPLAVMHFHSARRPLLDSFGVSVGRGQIVMSLRESRGNIWMTEIAK